MNEIKTDEDLSRFLDNLEVGKPFCFLYKRKTLSIGSIGYKFKIMENAEYEHEPCSKNMAIILLRQCKDAINRRLREMERGSK